MHGNNIGTLQLLMVEQDSEIVLWYHRGSKPDKWFQASVRFKLRNGQQVRNRVCTIVEFELRELVKLKFSPSPIARMLAQYLKYLLRNVKWPNFYVCRF